MSKFFSLNSSDFIKGLVVAVLSAVITLLYSTIQTGTLTIDWKQIGIVALTSALAYITKNLVTNSDGTLLQKEA
jgi:hypothetical protein